MKIKNFLKYALPLFAVTAASISLTIGLTSCGDNKNANLEITTKDKLNSFTTHFNKLLTIEKIKIDDEKHESLVVLDFEETVLSYLGIPQQLIQKFKVNTDFDQNDGLWKLEIELAKGYSFNPNLVKQKTKFVPETNHYLLTNNKLDFYFQSPFDYIGLHLNNKDSAKNLQNLMQQIPLISSDDLYIGAKQPRLLVAAYKWFVQYAKYSKLIDAINIVKIQNFNKTKEQNNWNYDITISSQSPYVFLSTDNKIQKEILFQKLVYSQENLDYKKYSAQFSNLINEFSEKTKLVTSEEQLNTLASKYQERVSQIFLGKWDGVIFDLTWTRFQGDKSYSLIVFLPPKYRIINLPKDDKDKKFDFIMGTVDNSI